jgi:autophagy-related protein 9
MRLNRAYRPSVKYTDLFVNPIATVLARNVAFVSGSLLAVLFTLTVVQEDLLTAHNILTSITLLGIIVTVCRIFIPNEVRLFVNIYKGVKYCLASDKRSQRTDD